MGDGQKILIVEDEASLRKALNDKLSRHGFDILEAKNGKEGLEAALSEKPDLILLDIVMPVMDGLAMLEKLREDDWGRDAQVVLLSNQSESNKVTKAMEYGVFDYWVKTDIELEKVVEKVGEKLGR